MENLEKECLIKLAKSWNNLNVCFIEDELTDNFTYESQWVLIPIKGKNEFLQYLQTKFNAIKTTIQNKFMSVTAELATHPDLNHRPIIVLTQITDEGMNQVSILINVENDKINRIDICFIPDPQEAELIGEIPK